MNDGQKCVGNISFSVLCCLVRGLLFLFLFIYCIFWRICVFLNLFPCLEQNFAEQLHCLSGARYVVSDVSSQYVTLGFVKT